MTFLKFLLLIIFSTNLNFTTKEHFYKNLEYIFIKHCTQKYKSADVERCVQRPLIKLFEKVDEGLNLTAKSFKNNNNTELASVNITNFFNAICCMESECTNTELFLTHIKPAINFCENMYNSFKNEAQALKSCTATMEKLFNFMKRDERIKSDLTFMKKEFLDLSLSLIQQLENA